MKTIPKLVRFLSFLVPFCLFTAPFLGPLITRILILMAISLASATLCLIIFPLRVQRKNKATQLFALLLVFIAFIYPILLSPIRFLKWEFVGENMLLFNYDIRYDALNEKLIFFQNPNSHHAYYPPAYVFGKIIYDLTGVAYLVHLLLLPMLYTILFLCFLSSLIRKVKSHALDDTILSIYCVCLFLISYLYTGGAISFWNFRSVGYLAVLALLISFMRFKTSTSNVAIMILLLPAVIMSDPIYLPTGLMVFLLYLYHLTRDKRVLGFARFMLVTFLAYQSFIGFISYVKYGDYLWVLKAQLEALLKFDPYLSVRTAVVDRPTVYPLLDRIFVFFSYPMIYGILPLILLFHFMKKVGWTKVVPLLMILMTVNTFNIAARLIPSIFINNIGAIFCYSYLPFSMLSLGFYVALLREAPPKKQTSTLRIVFERIFTSTLKWQHLWLTLLFLIIFFSSVNTIFVMYPKSIHDPVEFIDDARVMCYDTYFMANFLNNHWSEGTSVYYHVTSHLQERFIEEKIRLSWHNQERGLSIITFPILPTIFEDKAYRTIQYAKTSQSIIYDQGKWLILAGM